MWKHIRNLSIVAIIIFIGVGYWLTRPDVAQLPMDKVTGTNPEINNQARQQAIPTVNVAAVERWKDGEKPVAATGLKVELFAGDLNHPRNMLTLPNGDILVAETNGPPRKGGGGITAWAAGWLMKKAGAGEPSANRITLLRDNDSDGKIDLKTVFMQGLDSPFGMALIGDRLYIANTGAVVAVPYKDGDTKITDTPVNIHNLNSDAPNIHWTKNLIARKDGKKLYIAAGSNSNIAEGGLENEKGRAMIIEFDMATRKARPYSVGLRNPVGMDFDSRGRLWTVVNERDMLGSDTVPDYLALTEFASDYGWPWHYWGGFTDKRVQPMREDKRAYERRPDYALGPHVAALGLAFADKAKLGAAYASGAFVARHGSWNRVPASGYDVVFVKFNEKGQPDGLPMPILSGFLSKGGKAHGRPTMLTVAKDGALLVSDDVGNRVWRVTAG